MLHANVSAVIIELQVHLLVVSTTSVLLLKTVGSLGHDLRYKRVF
uniref:Bm13530 n=1 Tax=Brugia malayi TaxID=6279 RepID=A0A1I9G4A8_BRUMA|nr:Bm13530 [Brugia malayi]